MPHPRKSRIAGNQVMNLIAFGTSISTKSINKQLAAYAGSLLEDSAKGIELEVLDLNDYQLPLFSQDLENQFGQQENAKAFLTKIKEADGIIVSFSEHNGNYSAAWKNLFDWCSRIEGKVFQNTPIVILSTSPGTRGGATVMDIALSSLPRSDADIKASLSIPSFNENFDTQSGKLTNLDLKQQLQQTVAKLIE
jgi:chromate reductase, NAD(P)H dehydrogenase (quinone)